jgi:hypothetical protein
MQRLAAAARKHPRPGHGVDPMPLVGLGDRRKAHDFPVFLGLHVAGEIVLVQPRETRCRWPA